MKSKGTIKQGDKFNMLTTIKYIKYIKDISIKNKSVLCCKFCNMAKREYPVKEFLAWIERLKTLNSNTCL